MRPKGRFAYSLDALRGLERAYLLIAHPTRLEGPIAVYNYGDMLSVTYSGIT